MPDPNSPQRTHLLSLQQVYYLLKILCILIPVVCALYVWFGPQDIYWEQCPSPPSGGGALHSTGFNIINASFFPSPPLTFSVTVDVPLAKIAAAKTSGEVDTLLKDPNALAIDLGGNENTLQDKRPFGTNCTTMIEISRSAGLAGRDATMINFLWQKGKYVRFIDIRLYSGSPPYYKNYPQKSERHVFAQTKWQLIGFILAIVVVALMTILMRSLLRTKGDLDATKQTLGQEDSKLTEAERARTKAEEQLTKSQEALATKKTELSEKRTLLESARQFFSFTEEFGPPANPNARASYLGATEAQRSSSGTHEPDAPLPIKENVAKEYEQRT